MTRSHVTVRQATQDDLPAIRTLAEELRRMPARVWRKPGHLPRTFEARLAAVLADPDRRVVVATENDEPVGMVVLTAAPFLAFSDALAVQLDYLVVGPGHRRRGVGRALITAAVAYADEVGAEQVTAAMFATQREANRFFARLGFGPLVVRATPVSVLRRRLAVEGRAAAELLVRRRSLLTRGRVVVRRGSPAPQE